MKTNTYANSYAIGNACAELNETTPPVRPLAALLFVVLDCAAVAQRCSAVQCCRVGAYAIATAIAIAIESSQRVSSSLTYEIKSHSLTTTSRRNFTAEVTEQCLGAQSPILISLAAPRSFMSRANLRQRLAKR